MSKGKYVDDKYVNTNWERCGAVHPNHPGLTCIRFGKCLWDDHLGQLVYPDGSREMVRFGKVAEEHEKRYGKAIKTRVIWIEEDDSNN